MKILGRQHHLRRAVDQDSEVLDLFLQRRSDSKAAIQFFKRLLRSHSEEPRKVVTDKLQCDLIAHLELMPGMIHNMLKYAKKRIE